MASTQLQIIEIWKETEKEARNKSRNGSKETGIHRDYNQRRHVDGGINKVSLQDIKNNIDLSVRFE